MQVAVTELVAEHIGPLIDAFSARDPELDVAVESVRRQLAGRDARAPPRRHRPGPAPATRAGRDDRLGAVPALPAARRRRARSPAGRAPRLAAASWRASAGCSDRPVVDPTTGAGLLFTRAGIEPAAVVSYTSHAARGRGRRRRRRDRRDDGARGDRRTTAPGADPDRRARDADAGDLARQHAGVRAGAAGGPALQRFATSPEATQAISTGRAGTAPSRARPRPHVTLWSSVAAGLRTAQDS